MSDIVIWHLRQGQGLEEIAAQYNLTLSGVYAAIAYYYDQREQIDREIERNHEIYGRLREREHLSLVEQKLKSLDRD